MDNLHKRKTKRKEIQGIYQQHQRQQQQMSQLLLWDYALFLVEYGGVYYLSGEYKNGKEYCEEAIVITKQSNHIITPMMYACIGMSSMYLPGYEQYSLQHLRLSYQTILSSSNSTDNRANNTAGLFTVTKESLESSLFTSLHQYQQYEECLIFTKQMIARTLPTSLLATYRTTSTTSTGLDEVEIYLLVFSAIDWSPSNYHYLSQLDTLLQQQYPRYQQYKQQQHGLTSFREEIALSG